MDKPQTSRSLFLRLFAYFAGLIALVVLLAMTSPGTIRLLPLAGADAIEIADLLGGTELTDLLPDGRQARSSVTPYQAGQVVTFVAFSLLMTMALMLPVTWTYIATRQEAGFRKTFVRLLITLPICATTIVLLIQNSLALAFGLAALVAAVRFRVSLQDPIDGIYIFAAICVGLAAGIGYMGIATVMTIFFCFANAALWHFDYGRNALDDARIAKDRAKLDRRPGPGPGPEPEL
jgi:hypothetical protein